MKLLCHIIQRYGNPRYCDDKFTDFANYFRSHTGPTLVPVVLQNLMWQASGHFITADVHRSCLTFVANCVEMSPTYKVLKPHLEFLLCQVIFPTLCVTEAEIMCVHRIT